MTHQLRRREFLGASAAFVLATVSEARAQGGPRPTPACGEHGVTHPQTPGPYFKPQ